MSEPFPTGRADSTRDVLALLRARNSGDLEAVDVVLANCDQAEVCRELTGLTHHLITVMARSVFGVPEAELCERVDGLLLELLGQAQDGP